MKKYFSLLYFFLCFHISFGQTSFYSEPQDFNFSKDFFTIGGHTGDNLYIFFTEKDAAFIDIYNGKMEKKAKVTLNFMPEKIKDAKLLNYDDKIILLYTAQIGNKEIYYASILDAHARIVGKPLAIDTVSQKFIGRARKGYQFLVSSDQSKIALIGAQIRDNNLQYRISILDEQLQYVNKSEGKIKCRNNLDITQLYLTSDDKIILNINDKFDSRSKIISEAVLYTISATGAASSNANAYYFQLQRNTLDGLLIKEDLSNSNKVYFAGLYREPRSNNISGQFLGRYDFSENLQSEIRGSFQPFDENMKNTFSENNKKRAFNLFDVKDIVIKNSGGIIIVSESYYEVARSSGNSLGYGMYGYGYGMGNMGSNTRDYVYGDLMVVDYDNNFNKTWHTAIPKTQRTTDDGGIYSSYSLLNSGAQLVFLFNNFTNNNLRLETAIMEPNGKKFYKNIAAAGSKDGSWMPILGAQTENKEIVIPIVRSRSLYFAKINF